ncbi:MAG: carboxypeptidase regulatory-like domain-containing protein [Bacteroidetes bacterium]|nr:carboxypeptidase regulatory-like domain-containing protein [Bacteroidota bacterium]
MQRSIYAQALQYIAANKTALLANANMPADFEEKFTDAVEAFNTKLAAFTNAKIEAVEGTDAKMNANNAAYDKVIEKICSVGQVIFGDDATLKGEFSFEKMSEVLRPTGPAGLKGKVIYMIDGKPVVGAVGEIEGTKHTATTNKEGEYDFGSNLASGKFTVKWKLNDEVLAEEEVNIPAGVTVRDTVEVEVPGEPIVEVKVPGEPIV